MARVPGKVILDSDAQGVLPLLSLDRITDRFAATSATSASVEGN
jgi:hypothetical protein